MCSMNIARGEGKVETDSRGGGGMENNGETNLSLVSASTYQGTNTSVIPKTSTWLLLWCEGERSFVCGN